MSILFWGMVLFLVLPVISVSAYVLYNDWLLQQLRKNFQKILYKVKIGGNAEPEAKAVIAKLHKNRVAVIQLISLKTNRADEAIISVEILKAEIYYLLECLDQRRKQKIFQKKYSEKEEAEVIIFLANMDQKIKASAELPITVRIWYLAELYRMVILLYSALPDENDYPELKFRPLFEIVNLTPTRKIRIFPAS